MAAKQPARSKQTTGAPKAKSKPRKPVETHDSTLGSDLERVRAEARNLEQELEVELLRDAVLSARLALEELNSDTHGPPFERRRGLRLREKAQKVERAFNRLRALRLGLLLPDREFDE